MPLDELLAFDSAVCAEVKRFNSPPDDKKPEPSRRRVVLTDRD